MATAQSTGIGSNLVRPARGVPPCGRLFRHAIVIGVLGRERMTGLASQGAFETVANPTALPRKSPKRRCRSATVACLSPRRLFLSTLPPDSETPIAPTQREATMRAFARSRFLRLIEIFQGHHDQDATRPLDDPSRVSEHRPGRCRVDYARRLHHSFSGTAPSDAGRPSSSTRSGTAGIRDDVRPGGGREL